MFISTGDPWMDAMRRGEFSAAWKISDDVLRGRAGQPCWHWPRHQQYIWDGRPLDGKRVLVRCYHGLGDTIQFIRYVPLLKRIAKEVIVWAQPVLIPLLQTAEGIDQLLPLHDGVPDIEYDVDVELMELAHVFRSTLDTLPGQVPYLHVEPSEVLFADRERAALEVGVVWQSGDWDARRSLPLSRIWRWADIPGVRLHSLQRGTARREWTSAIGEDSSSDDPLKTARVMRALDLVISVDSMPAHLGGALGVPTWTLLHYDPDWRWMLDRDDSPWYPTMRLFRQPRPGDWERVADDVAAALENEVRKTVEKPLMDANSR